MGTVSLVCGSIVNGHFIAASSDGRGKSVSNPYSLQSFPLVEKTDVALLGVHPFPFEVSAAMLCSVCSEA